MRVPHVQVRWDAVLADKTDEDRLIPLMALRVSAAADKLAETDTLAM